MGRWTKPTPLPDSPYDPRITDLSNPLRPPRGRLPSGQVDTWENRNVANTTPIQVPQNQSIRVLPANKRRSGIVIQNKDPTNTLFYAFGNDASANSISIGPSGKDLYDFTTPPDELYLFCTGASIQATVMEISRRRG